MRTDELRRWQEAVTVGHRGYSLAVLATLVAALARYALDPALGNTVPFFTFFLATLAAALNGGLGPGLLATAIGALLGAWLFVEPRGGAIPGDKGIARLLIFLAVGLGVSVVAGGFRARRRMARTAEAADRRRAEEALRKSEAFAQRILASSLSGLYVYDLSPGIISYVSPQYTRLTGYRLDEVRALAGPAILELFHPEDRAKVAAHVAGAVGMAADEVREVEYRFKRADGRWMWCYSRETVFTRNPDGSVRQYLGTFLDITERKRAEEALRESELFYRQTLESIPGMVFTTRPDGYCDYQSRQWVSYTGVPMSEHLGDGWNRLLHPDDRPRAFATWRAALEGTARYDLEYRVRRHDGVYEWFKVIGEPIRDASGRIVRWFGVALNIEDIKRAEAELQAARRAAEEASRAKDHFLAVLSHELRTPLTPAVAALSILQKTGRFDASTRDSLEIIRRNVEMEARLIDDLLDVTRIVRGKVELDRRAVPIGDVINRAIEVCRPDIEARRLHFGSDLGPCAACIVYTAAAGLLEPPAERHQVHASRRLRRRPLPARGGPDPGGGDRQR